MNGLLKEQQEVRLSGNETCKVVKLLGGGGQGEVYRVSYRGNDHALKWYFPQSATDQQKKTLEKLIADGKPDPVFLWPESLASADGVNGYGYLMALRPPEYKSLQDFMMGKIDVSFLQLFRACIELCKAFRALHTKGLCYQDISFGNAFLRPDTGEVLVCDNDNVTANDANVGGVLGTADFMAPEVVRGDAKPSNKTDLHSLAVLLFYMLFMGHPLQGKKILGIRCWDGPARDKLFGGEPVFIFDPQDQSNEAVDLAHDPTGEAGGNAIRYWNDYYPTFFRKVVTKAFTEGLKDTDFRVNELEWLTNLTRLRDSMFKCGSCGRTTFYDADMVQSGGACNVLCKKCNQTLILPFRIRIGRNVVMLNADTKLYQHHMDDKHDFSKPVAEVSKHPTDPNIWGLKNLSGKKWTATMADGAVKDVEVGRSVPLASGIKIQFGGNVEGEIRYH